MVYLATDITFSKENLKVFEGKLQWKTRDKQRKHTSFSVILILMKSNNIVNIVNVKDFSAAIFSSKVCCHGSKLSWTMNYFFEVSYTLGYQVKNFSLLTPSTLGTRL